MKVIVIGCGAAGAAAAIAAAQAGHRVTVLDRNRKPLKKLGVTGNGRGNLLNRGELRYYGDSDFALRVLEHMPRPEVEEFLQNAGVSLTEEDEGRVYPACYQASAAVDALLAQMDTLGVERRQNVRVTALRREDSGFLLEGVESVYGEEKSKKNGKVKKGELLEERTVCFQTDRVIAAFGGAAAPAHGTDGTAYGLLTELGHTLHTPCPALCPLVTAAVRFQRGGAERAQRSHMPAIRPLSQTIRFGMQFDPFGHIIGMTVFAGAEPQQDQIQVVFPAKGQQVVHVGKIVLTGFPFQLIPVDGRFQQVAAVGLDRSQLPRHHLRVAHRGIMGLGTQQQQGLPLCICQKRHLSTLPAGLRAKIH